jgi:hypothetical protein
MDSMLFFRKQYFDVASFLIVFFFLLIFGIPLNQALLATSVVGIQLRTGSSIFQTVFKKPIYGLSQFFSFGFTFGVTASSLSIVIFQGTFIASMSWCVPSLIVLGRHILRRDSSPIPVTLMSNIGAWEFLLVFLVASCFLYQDFNWMIFFIIPSLISLFLIGYRTQNTKFHLRTLIGFTFISFTTLFWFFNNRGDWWWFISDDFQFFEAIQFSISNFGIADQFGPLGENWFGYHILLFVWSGSIDTILGALPFLTLTQIVPPIMAVYLASAVISFFTVDKEIRLSRLTPLIVCIPFLFFYTFTSPTLPIGLGFLITFLNVIRITNVDQIRPIQLFTISFLGMATIYSKFSNLPFLIIIAFSIFVSSYRLRSRQRIKCLLFSLSVVVSPVIFVSLTLLTNHLRSKLEPSLIVGFAIERIGSLKSVDTPIQRYFLGLFTTTEYFVIPAISLIAILLIKKREVFFAKFVATLTVLFSFSIAVFSGNGNYGYFVSTGLFVMYLAVYPIFETHSNSTKSTLVVFLFGALYRVITNRISEQVFSTMKFSDLTVSVLLSATWPFLLFATISIFVVTRMTSEPFGIHRIISILIIFVLGASVASNPAIMGRSMRGSELNEDTFQFSLGSYDDVGVSEWIRKNTATDSIFASNYFCDFNCVGTNWITSKPEFAGSNFLLPALSRRRFFIQGTRFVGGSVWPDWVFDRMRASTEYPMNQSPNGRLKLSLYGIDYFVFDKTGVSLSVDSSNNLVYENDRFAVVAI